MSNADMDRALELAREKLGYHDVDERDAPCRCDSCLIARALLAAVEERDGLCREPTETEIELDIWQSETRAVLAMFDKPGQEETCLDQLCEKVREVIEQAKRAEAAESRAARSEERLRRVERVAAFAILMARHGEYSNGVLGPAGEDEGVIRSAQAMGDIDAEAKALGIYIGGTFYDIDQHYTAAPDAGSEDR